MGLYIGKMDRKWLSRVLIIMLADILGILGSYLLALWARFDLHFMDIPPEFLQGYLSTIWWWVLICLAVFWLCNLYNSIWRFVSVDALMRIILAYVILGGLSFGCVKLFHIVMPRSYYVWGLLCSFFITAGIRFFYRGVRYLRNRVPGSQKGTENVMIIGAGQAGRQLIREYAVSSHLNSRVACLIDDNPAKRGRILEGVRIVGGRRDIPQAVKRYDIRKIIFAIPSLQGAGRQEILNICSKTGCQIQVVPGIYQLVKGEVTISKLRRVELQDLLGRDPIRVNLGEICGYINDKTVLITGGGGSIGSELCRQIARHKPRRLVIFDIYENNAYDIQMELRREHPELTLDVCIGSVRDRGRVDDLLDTYQPDLIFHAAAHKHVPLMEDSPNEAIKNNVFGTYVQKGLCPFLINSGTPPFGGVPEFFTGAFIPQNRKWPSFPAGGRSGPSTGGAWGTHHRPPGPPDPCPAGSAHGTGSPGPRSYGIPPRPGRRECPRLRRKSPGSPADMPASPRRQPGTGPECSASCRSPLTGRHTAGSGPGS